jgi:hypothetical protein
MRPRRHIHYPRAIVPESPLVPIAIALRNILLALAAGCVLMSTCEGRAQDTTATTLARLAIGESDWHARDQAAALHVVKRRAERAGVSLEQMATAYSAVFSGKGSPRKAWVLAIEADCKQPSGWPQRLRWARYAQRCRDTFARVERFLRGELPDPCPRAEHFGSRVLRADVERAERAVREGRWTPARCRGETVNAYFARGAR